MCQNSLPSGGGRSLGAKISGGRGRSRQCKLHRAKCRQFDTIPACDRRTDGQTGGQTDGIAVASAALAMRRAVKTEVGLVSLICERCLFKMAYTKIVSVNTNHVYDKSLTDINVIARVSLLNLRMTFSYLLYSLQIRENCIRFCSFYSAPQCWHCKRCTSYGNSVRLSCWVLNSSVTLAVYVHQK